MVVDGNLVAFVTKASVVDLMEAVNEIILEWSSDKEAGGEV